MVNAMEDTLSTRQAVLWVSLFELGSSILFAPAFTTAKAGQDGWLSALVAVALHLAVLPLFVAWGRSMGNRTVAAYMADTLGKPLGRTVMLLLALGFPYLTFILALRNLSDFTMSATMIETPRSPIMLLMGALAACGIYYGIRAIGRTAEIAFPFVILFIFIIILSLIPDIRADLLLPFGERGVGAIAEGAIPLFGFPYLDIFMLLGLRPHLKNKSDFSKILIGSGLISGCIFVLLILFTILTLGGDLPSRFTHPTYFVVRTISIGEFYKRIEALVSFVWYILIFFRIALVLYLSSSWIAEAIGVRDHRRLLPPLVVLAVSMANWVWPNVTYLIEFVNEWPYYAAVVGLLLPACILAIGRWRSRPA